MDLKNVIFAIALSFAVLFGWSVIFETPQIEEQKKLEQSKNSTNTESDDSDVPSVSVEKEKVDELIEMLPKELLTENAANDIIMAARAHWFADEDPGPDSLEPDSDAALAADTDS